MKTSNKQTYIALFDFSLLHAGADFSTPGYLGCFKDSDVRDLTGKLIKYNGELTAQTCRSACSGYTYFAMQEANTCLCGNRLGLYGQAAESNSDMKCQGNRAEWCGGDLMNSAYCEYLVRMCEVSCESV